MAIVRDCFGGRDMARVMSYVMIVFMIVPIVAPTLGQVVIAYADWHWIFILIGVVGAALFVWALARMKVPAGRRNVCRYRWARSFPDSARCSRTASPAAT